MYCFAKICCLCLQYNQDLNKLEEEDSHGMTIFQKLIVLIPRFEKLVKKSIPNYICRKCKRYLSKFYKFQLNCLKSYQRLESYLKQLDTENNETEVNVIEDDLILIKEDMEECLKNMEIYVKVKENLEKTPNEACQQQEVEATTTRLVEEDPKPEATSNKKRTRECKKISYNEEYDSDAMVSDSELYYMKGAKRKPKPKKTNELPKENKTVVIPQNDVFAKDLTKTINDIITRLAARNVSTTKPEEFKVKFKNSSGNTEQLCIYQDRDTVEIKFTKEGKLGCLKVRRSGDNFILSHNMSETIGIPQQLEPLRDNLKPNTPEETITKPEIPNPECWDCRVCLENFRTYYALTEHMNNHMNFMNNSCKICDKVFGNAAQLNQHINVHYSTKQLPENAPESTEPDCVDADPGAPLKEVQESPASSPKANQCEIKVVLSEIPENPIKSERSSSPEYQFHLSDDTDDEFDNDTLLLDDLDNENDFSDARSPSPVELGSDVLGFLRGDETPRASEEDAPPLKTLGNSSGSLGNNQGSPKILMDTSPVLENENEMNLKKKDPVENGLKQMEAQESTSPEDAPPNNQICSNGEDAVIRTPPKRLSNGIDLNDSFQEKLLKIIVNKSEVDDFIRNKNEEYKKSQETIRVSPRRQPNKICPHCKDLFKTKKKLEAHLEKAHQIFRHNLEV